MKLNGRVSQHDKYQIEVKFVCPLDRERKINDYHIDVFFFLPRHLGINRHSYSRDQFYTDLTEYIRLKTPEVEISELIHEDSAIFKRLADVFESYRKGETDAAEECTRQLKMFCSVTKVAFRDGAARILEQNRKKRIETIPDYLAHVDTVMENYRKMRSSLPENDARFLQELFDLVDEFLGVTANTYKKLLWKSLTPEKRGTEQPVIDLIRESVLREIAYRKGRGYPSVPEPGADNAELLYRESAIKKTMASVLYLKVAVREAGVLLENIFLSVAAAVAMIFVTGIAFLWRGLFLEEFSLSFFIVWVVAYMFKDRIKALLQKWFSSHKASYSFDYNQKIYDSMGKKVGLCREGVMFRSEKDMDPEICEIRNRSSLSRHVNGPLSEEILTFRKRIELYTKPCEDIYRVFRVDGVNDIIRFNVREWLRKMDNPVRQMFYPAEDGSLGVLKAKRLYHVNMLIRYGGNGRPDECMRFRLVLARNGIKDVEYVSHKVLGENEP